MVHAHGRRPTFRKCAHSFDSGMMDQSKFTQVIESDYDTDDIVADLLGLQKTPKVKIKEVTYHTGLFKILLT